MWGDMDPTPDPGSDDLERIRKKHRNKKPTEHPDMVKSSSEMHTREVVDGWIWVLNVKGLGAVVIHTSNDPWESHPQVVGVAIQEGE